MGHGSTGAGRIDGEPVTDHERRVRRDQEKSMALYLAVLAVIAVIAVASN